MNTTLPLGFTLMLLANLTFAGAQDLPCSPFPGTAKIEQKITTELCSELSSRAEVDYLPVVIYFVRASMPTDTVDPKKDTTGTKPPTSTGGEPAEYTEYTRKLFSDYDLRSAVDSSRRLSAPTTIEGSYWVLATKKTILQLNQAEFIMSISYWNPQTTSLRPSAQIAANPTGVAGFDLKGRAIRVAPSRVHRLVFRR